MIELLAYLLLLPVTIAIISIYYMLYQIIWNYLERVFKYFGF